MRPNMAQEDQGGSFLGECEVRLARKSFPEVGRSLEHTLELRAPGPCFLGAVKLLYQSEKAVLKIGNVHIFGDEINIEKRAKIPSAIPDDTAFLFQPPVQRRARKS